MITVGLKCAQQSCFFGGPSCRVLLKLGSHGNWETMLSICREREKEAFDGGLDAHNVAAMYQKRDHVTNLLCQPNPACGRRGDAECSPSFSVSKLSLCSSGSDFLLL